MSAMKPINKLEAILTKELKWNKQRIACFAQMLLAMMVVRTVNLTVIAAQVCSKAKLSNRYRRLQRFFQNIRIDYDVIACFIFRIFCFGNNKVYLTMDRTNWKWGKKDINILFIGIVYRGIAIPIYWLVLNKRGNSSTRERIALVSRFIKIFGKDRIAGLLADREFIGKKWFDWLSEEGIPFYIRIRNDANTQNKNGKDIDVSWLFHNLKPGEKLSLTQSKNIFGSKVFLTGGKAPGGELMIIASNVATDDAIEIYLLRWQIEVLFHSLKSRGFNFEDTHITDRNKIKKLIVLLAIGFCWAHKTGEWRCANEKQIKLKKHGRKEKSIFRYGLDLIQTALSEMAQAIRPIMRLIQLLRPPPDNLVQLKNPLIIGRRIF
jgi:hypothetical protein